MYMYPIYLTSPYRENKTCRHRQGVNPNGQQMVLEAKVNLDHSLDLSLPYFLKRVS